MADAIVLPVRPLQQSAHVEMGDDGDGPMDISPSRSPTPAPKTPRKRQTNGERAANFLSNTAAVRPGNIAAHMASAERMRERKLKEANDTLEQLREDMLGGAPYLPPCKKCTNGAYEVDPTLYPHTVAARDFCRKGVQLPRNARCNSCGDEHYLDPLHFGFFSPNPVKKVW